MTLRAPRNKMHRAKPSPDNMKSRINTNRPIKEIKDGRGVGKRHSEDQTARTIAAQKALIDEEET